MVATSQVEAFGIILKPEFTGANLMLKSAAKTAVPYTLLPYTPFCAENTDNGS